MSKCDGPTHLVDSTYSVLLVIISSVVFLSCSILSSALSSTEAFIDIHDSADMVKKMLKLIKVTCDEQCDKADSRMKITFFRLSSSTWSSAQGWQ